MFRRAGFGAHEFVAERDTFCARQACNSNISTMNRQYVVYLSPEQLDEKVATYHLLILVTELADFAQTVSRGVKFDRCVELCACHCLLRELCSRPEFHGVSIGDVEDFSLPGLALRLLNTQSVPLSCAFLVCKCLLSDTFVESDGNWFWFLIIAEGSVFVGAIRFCFLREEFLALLA